MQNQEPSANDPLMPQPNISPSPTPGMPPPAQYPYPPAPIPGTPPPAQYPYPSPYQQYYSPYQQNYPPYTPATHSMNQDVIKSSLIGGSIACGIDVLFALLTVFVPAVGSVLFPLYQFGPLLQDLLSVGGLIISLIIALLCSPGFFVAGLRTIRKTGSMSSVMLACTLALVGFAVVDLLITIAMAAHDSTFMPPSVISSGFWVAYLLGWFTDLIMAIIVGFGAAALGATIGKQQH